jgi:hypothetical protein
MENEKLKKQRGKRVRAYLKNYLDRPSEVVKESLKDCKAEDNLLIRTKNYNQIISYLLMKDGRKRYYVCSSTQIIESYIDRVRGIKFIDYVKFPVLIIIIDKDEMKNVRRFDLPIQICIERNLRGKGTVVLTSFVMDAHYEDVFKSHGFKIVKIKKDSVFEEDTF